MIELGFMAFFMAWLVVSEKASVFERPRTAVRQWAMVAERSQWWPISGLGWFVKHLGECAFCIGTHFAWIVVLLAEGWDGPRVFFIQWMTVAGVNAVLVYLAVAAEALDEHG